MSRLGLVLVLGLAAVGCSSSAPQPEPRWCYVVAESERPTAICTEGGETMCERSRESVVRQGLSTTSCRPLRAP